MELVGRDDTVTISAVADVVTMPFDRSYVGTRWRLAEGDGDRRTVALGLGLAAHAAHATLMNLASEGTPQSSRRKSM